MIRTDAVQLLLAQPSWEMEWHEDRIDVFYALYFKRFCKWCWSNIQPVRPHRDISCGLEGFCFCSTYQHACSILIYIVTSRTESCAWPCIFHVIGAVICMGGKSSCYFLLRCSCDFGFANPYK